MSFSLPLIINVLTSGVVGLLAFVIGVRLGKEQTDRPALRKIYQDIYGHFRALIEAIDAAAPKEFGDYPLSANKYWPPVRAMERDGSLNMMPPTLARDLLAAEGETLSAGWKFGKCVTDDIVPLVKGIFAERVNAPEKSVPGRSYMSCRTGLIALENDAAWRARAERFGDPKLGFAAELATERGRTEQLYAYSETIRDGDLASLAGELRAAVAANTSVRTCAADLLRQRERLTELLGALSRRIADPYPLRETLLSAVPDLFRRG